MKKILIISPAWIGDAIMAQSLYKILKHGIPECRLEVLAPRWTLPVLSRMPEVADALLYSAYANAMREARAKSLPDVAFCLNQSQWDDLNGFVAAANAHLVFGLNFFLNVSSDQVSSLLRYTADSNYTVFGYEYGTPCSDDDDKHIFRGGLTNDLLIFAASRQ